MKRFWSAYRPVAPVLFTGFGLLGLAISISSGIAAGIACVAVLLALSALSVGLVKF